MSRVVLSTPPFVCPPDQPPHELLLFFLGSATLPPDKTWSQLDHADRSLSSSIVIAQQELFPIDGD